MSKNYLYVAYNDDEFLKMGITDKDPHTRIHSFGRKYPKKFKHIIDFNIINYENNDIETIIHQFFNSQLLNTALLYKECNIIEFQPYVEKSPNGYTEIFLSNPIYLANVLTILHLISAIELSENDLKNIENNIYAYPIQIIEKKYRTELNEIKNRQNNEVSLVKNVSNNKNNIHKLNFKNFLEISNKTLNFQIHKKENEYYFTNGEKQTNLVNFLHGNNSFDVLHQVIKTQLKSNIDISSLKKLLVDNNKSVTTQKSNTLNKKVTINKLINSLSKESILKELLLSECLNILSTTAHKDFFNQIKNDIISGEIYKRLNFHVLNSDNLFDKKDNQPDEITLSLKRLSVLIYEFKNNISEFHPFANTERLKNLRDNVLKLCDYANYPENHKYSYKNQWDLYYKCMNDIKTVAHNIWDYPETFRYISAIFEQNTNKNLAESLFNKKEFFFENTSFDSFYLPHFKIFNPNKLLKLKKITPLTQFIENEEEKFDKRLFSFLYNHHRDYNKISETQTKRNQIRITEFCDNFCKYMNLNNHSNYDPTFITKVFSFLKNNYMLFNDNYNGNYTFTENIYVHNTSIKKIVKF